MERFEPLAGYEFSGCAVRRWNIIAFWGQRWDTPDPLETRTTGVFFYYPDEPAEEQWAHREIGRATGLHGCAAGEPEERWVFVADDGEVYVVGGGADDFEQRVSQQRNAYFSNVRGVAAGRAIAVGPRRKVFVRRGPGSWERLDAGLFPQGEQTDLETAGFSDVDGFSDGDLYACGGRGDLWHFNGAVWTRADIPTNADLRRICCASDGQVYVIAGSRQVLKGRGAIWTVVGQGETSRVLESVVDYRGKVLISTEKELLEVTPDGLRQASLGEMPPMRSRAHLAVGDGVLLVAGRDEACSYDGTTWSVILTPGS
jgi:hypothetical protein